MTAFRSCSGLGASWQEIRRCEGKFGSVKAGGGDEEEAFGNACPSIPVYVKCVWPNIVRTSATGGCVCVAMGPPRFLCMLSLQDCVVKMKLVAPPLYVLATQTLDKQKGIDVLSHGG
eukprot:scaffold88785_cov19-Tisochrysis_lutea.AAC.1